MDDYTRVSEPHPKSHRRAVVDDDGDSVWLYLTIPDSLDPSADCWLYNRRRFTNAEVEAWPRDRPPPAPEGTAHPDSSRDSPLPEGIEFHWDKDGESVAVSFEGETLGFIAAGQHLGYSRYLALTGPWGSPFDHRAFEALFGSGRPAA